MFGNIALVKQFLLVVYNVSLSRSLSAFFLYNLFGATAAADYLSTWAYWNRHRSLSFHSDCFCGFSFHNSHVCSVFSVHTSVVFLVTFFVVYYLYLVRNKMCGVEKKI